MLDALDSPLTPEGLLIAAGRKVLGNFTIGRHLRAMALVPPIARRPFLIAEGRTYRYADALREAERWAALFQATRRASVSRGELSPGAPLAVGIYRDNSASYVFAVLGAALSGDVIVALNTGFRGDTLAALVERADVRLLVTSGDFVGQLEAVLAAPGGSRTLRRDRVLVEPPGEVEGGMRAVEDALREAEARGPSHPASGKPRPADGNQPLLVVYTSGTTGVPKGIGCSHLKLMGAGYVAIGRTWLRPADRGYVAMPLFHSNAWLLGVMPLLMNGGSFVLKPRFSASAFERDVLEHGVTYMNYVGQPLHYIVLALEKRHGSPAAVEAALARHPKNRFRIAHGNGATPADREKLVRYLGMDHVYELYGSTEAVINTVVEPGDPKDSVGRIRSADVVILDEQDRECAPAEIDARGRIANYDRAVGEICARADRESLLFDGYYGDADSTARKYRGGFYRSGDLGHVRVVKGKRYLYFDGRTEDWIRKDGENFSAESVARFAREHPSVALAAAYGVPAPVSDELVMVTVQLREGAAFDPTALHAYFVQQQREGGMDPKWMPDFVRVIDVMPMTSTDKVLARRLKREHVDVASDPSMRVWFRRRGDTDYRPFGAEELARFRAELAANGRAQLLGERPAPA
jgi:fatty-acyl-CoA synthase